MTKVNASQRYTLSIPCPVCGGHAEISRGQGLRCWGFLSSGGGWAVCTRPEASGGLQDTGVGYSHRLVGSCRCGVAHGGWVPPPITQPPVSSDNGAYARTLWEEASSAKGTIVEAYLNSRGINGPIPPSLRFHPALKHKGSGQVLPAMVAAVTIWPSDKVLGIQRTWLRRDGTSKAPVKPHKMSLGPTAEGTVQLAECGSVVGLAEGVETALSVQQELGIPMWVALGSGNFGKVVLPPLPLVSEVRLYVDGDAGGRDAVADLAPRLHDEGRKVVPCHAPEGFDFNDLLLQARAES